MPSNEIVSRLNSSGLRTKFLFCVAAAFGILSSVSAFGSESYQSKKQDKKDPLAAAIASFGDQKELSTSGKQQGQKNSDDSSKNKGMATSDPSLANQSAVGATQGKRVSQPHKAFDLVRRSKKVWEFGAEVHATGATLGMTVTAPVPIDWPEQKVRIIEKNKSPQVRSIKYKNHGKLGRQMVISIPRLGAGQTAKATVTMELTRYDIISPEQLPELIFVPKSDRTVRTFLRPSPYIESNHRRIKEIATKIHHPDLPPYQQVEKIYDWVQSNIKYKFDTQIHSCLWALDNKQGDCEEVASLFVAICRAKGIPARAVWCNDHTYPEFLLKTKDGKKVWLPCEITTIEHVFGQYYGDRPILQKGDRFKVKGHRKEQRYLVPTLSAKRAAGAPQLKWISRPANSTITSPGSSGNLGPVPRQNTGPLGK